MNSLAGSRHVWHVSYATSDYKSASKILRKSARRYGLDGHFRVYGPEDDVARRLFAEFPETMKAPRGAGYWLWKPFVIREALKHANDGDTVLYTDAASFFVANPKPLLDLTSIRPVVLFELSGAYPQKDWTKRDCFVALDADTEDHWNTQQLLAGFQLYRAGPQARTFIEGVCTATATDHVLTDAANVLGKPNFPGFNDHRHDQSVLTIMARKHQRDVALFPDPSQWGPKKPLLAREQGDGFLRPESPFGQIIDAHRLKDPRWRWLSHQWRRLP